MSADDQHMTNRSIHGAVDLYRRNRALVWLCIVVFVTDIGFGAIVPVIPLFARSFGVSQSAIGLTLAVYAFARFLVSVPTGQMADRIGRRWTIVLGQIVAAACNVLSGLAVDFESFLVFRFLAGVGASMVMTSAQIMLADISSREDRGRVMSIYQGVFLLGVGFGPLPGGVLAQRFGLGVPFFVFAVMGLAAGLLTVTNVPETRGLRERRERAIVHAEGTAALPVILQLRAVFSQVGFVLVSLVAFSQFFARTGLIMAVVPIMVSVKMGLDPDHIGVVMSVGTFCNLSVVYLAGMLVDRFGRKSVIVPSTLVTAASLASYAVAPDYQWVLVSAAVWGIAGGIAGPAPTAYAADVAPPGMNAITMSSHKMLCDLGSVLGPLAAGWAADGFGNEAAFYGTAVLVLLIGGLFAIYAPETAGRRSKPAQAHPAQPAS